MEKAVKFAAQMVKIRPISTDFYGGLVKDKRQIRYLELIPAADPARTISLQVVTCHHCAV